MSFVPAAGVYSIGISQVRSSMNKPDSRLKTWTRFYYSSYTIYRLRIILYIYHYISICLTIPHWSILGTFVAAICRFFLKTIWLELVPPCQASFRQKVIPFSNRVILEALSAWPASVRDVKHDTKFTNKSSNLKGAVFEMMFSGTP
jgi:hypothetical protein